MKTLFHRIISDYFLRNRIKLYDSLLELAKKNGYVIMKHSDFFELAKAKAIGNSKILLIRHDIDSDPKYVHQWLAVEKKHNVKTSYYFRLCTLDRNAMNAVINQGSDCGYHYEELATFVKRNALPLNAKFENYFDEIRNQFEENLKFVEKVCGFKIKSIASHGDFMNRKIGKSNYVFIDSDFLIKNGIDFESYQSEFVGNYSINIMDYEYPKYYSGNCSPTEAIEANLQIVHLLFHPKNWRTNWISNTLENWRRLREGIGYSIRSKIK